MRTAPALRTEWWRPDAGGGAVLPRLPQAGQDSAVPFAALLVFTAVLLLAPQAFIPGLGRVRIAMAAGAFALVTHCWTRFAAGRPVMRVTREMGLIAVLVGWMVLTLPLSQLPAASAGILFGDFLKTLGVFWLLANAVSTLGRLRTVAWVVTLAAAPIAGTGLWNFVSGNLDRGRIVGFEAPMTSDPNALAMVLNLILPLTVALLLVNRRPVIRGLLIALIALDVSAIVATFSRGGFLTLAVIFLLYLRTLQRGGRRRWAAGALVLVIAAVPILPLGYVERLSTIRNIEGDETGSAQERRALNEHGLSYVLTHPLLGAGIGLNVIADCKRRGFEPTSCGRQCIQMPVPPCLFVHNVYLQYAMDLGWLGLVLFAALLLTCLGGITRVRNGCAASGRHELGTWAEAIRIGIVAFAVAAMFYPWAYYVYFYFSAGLAIAAGGIYAAEASDGGS